jgi:hypothetical protein
MFSFLFWGVSSWPLVLIADDRLLPAELEATTFGAAGHEATPPLKLAKKHRPARPARRACPTEMDSTVWPNQPTCLRSQSLCSVADNPTTSSVGRVRGVRLFVEEPAIERRSLTRRAAAAAK